MSDYDFFPQDVFPFMIKCAREIKRPNPLPDYKILDWSKLKQIADNILKYI